MRSTRAIETTVYVALSCGSIGYGLTLLAFDLHTATAPEWRQDATAVSATSLVTAAIIMTTFAIALERGQRRHR